MADIFISYAHIDNEPFGEERARWVSEFAENLRKRLGMVAGEAADVWRDPRLQGNDAIWPTIEGALAEAFALVSVISPRYVTSESCRREIDLFVQKWHERGVPPPGPRKPLFKVVKTHVPRDQHPDVLRDVNGYEFYEEDKSAQRFREFGLHPDERVNRLYWTRIDDLAQDIGAILGAALHVAARGDVERPAVYVAQTTRDVREARDAIARELKDRGAEVLPLGDLASTADELVTSVRGDLARSRFSVHVVGTREGFVPEGEHRSVVELQYVIAQQLGVPGLLWCPHGTQAQVSLPGEEADRTIAARLAPTAIPENRFDCLRGTLNEVKALLLSRLAEPAPTQVTSIDTFAVYLVHLRKALAEVQLLETELQERWPPPDSPTGCLPLRVLKPIDRGTPAQLRMDHEAKLAQSDGVVIMSAGAPLDWIAARLIELRRAGLASERPPRAMFHLPASVESIRPFPGTASVDDLLTLLAGVPPR